MTVADTDVLIDYLREVSPGADWIERELATGGLSISAITRFELLAGARQPKHLEKVTALIALVTTIPLSDAAADRAGDIARDLAAKGQEIGTADTLIAGTVLVHGGTLLTRNRKHFERVPGLALADRG